MVTTALSTVPSLWRQATLSPTVTLPPMEVRQWRSLIACRQTWVGRRIAVQNRIRALFVAQGLPAPRGAKAWTATGLAGC